MILILQVKVGFNRTTVSRQSVSIRACCTELSKATKQNLQSFRERERYIGMDPVNSSDPCIFVKEETTVFVDAATVARRKRMEIRRFKQMSSGSNSAHSHVLHKRSRPHSSGICELCDTEDDNYILCNKSELEVPLVSQFLAEADGKEGFGHAIVSSGSSPFRSGGLVRSKSFPPEGWHRSSNSQCVFKFSKTSHTGTATEVEGLVVTLVDDELRSTVKDTKPGLCATLTMEVSSSSPTCAHRANVEEKDAHQQPQRDERSMGVLQRNESSSVTSGSTAEPRPEGLSSENVVSDSAYQEREFESSTDGSNRRTVDQAVKAFSTNPSNKAASKSISSASRCFNDGKCPPCGKLLVCGRRREMEDTVAVVPSFASLPCGATGGCQFGNERSKNFGSDMHFFAVYDGHGGSQASKFCAERFHQVLGDELSHTNFNLDLAEGWASNWENLMTSCFLKIDKEVGGVCPTGECDDGDGTSTCCVNAIAAENVGTTAVVAVVGSSQIIVGNCGDSRAVLSRDGKAIPLSKDHKPEREDENNRIEAAGGRVIYWDGYRVGGLLALSRALGDRYLKRYVIAEPDVTCLQRTDEDECLILASDGLWDVISNEVACEVARKSLATAWRKCERGTSSPGEDSAPAQVAALLVKLAYGRGSKDNISVVVVDLKGKRS